MEYTTIIVMLALLQYMYFTVKVGAARGKYDIKAPACTGNDTFERIFRIHQNTCEQIIIFIPAIYGFSYYINPVAGSCIGIFYIIGRFAYYNAYLEDPARRGPGMLMTFITNGVLVLGTTIGVIIRLLP